MPNNTESNEWEREFEKLLIPDDYDWQPDEDKLKAFISSQRKSEYKRGVEDAKKVLESYDTWGYEERI